MTEAGYQNMEAVPSFLIQSLVWNVPDSAFYNEPLTENVRRIIQVSHAQLSSPEFSACMREENGMKLLFGASQQWTVAQARSFLENAWDFCKFKSL